MACAKDPSICSQDSTRTLERIATPSVTTSFDCFEVLQRDIELVVPIQEERAEGQQVRYVKLKLTAADSANIQAEIECPPTEREIIEVPKPFPVEQKLTEWKLFWKAKGMIASASLFTLIAGIVLGFILRGRLKPP